MAIGLAIAPARIFRAFVRGRHTRNLYAERFDDALLATSVGALRKRLELASPLPAATPWAVPPPSETPAPDPPSDDGV